MYELQIIAVITVLKWKRVEIIKNILGFEITLLSQSPQKKSRTEKAVTQRISILNEVMALSSFCLILKVLTKNKEKMIILTAPNKEYEGKIITIIISHLDLKILEFLEVYAMNNYYIHLWKKQNLSGIKPGLW